MVQPGLHRSRGDPKTSSHLVHGQIPVEAERDHDLVVGLEMDEGPVKGVARQELAGSVGRMRVAALVVAGQRDDRMAPPLP